MRYRIIVPVLVSLSCFPAGCSSEGQADESLSFETVSVGTWNGITNQRSEVIYNDTELSAFWSALMNGVSPAIPVPTVDFSAQVVIGVVAPEGTFGVTITRIERKGRGMVVNATVASCNSICPAVVLRPYHVVRTGKLLRAPPVDFVFLDELF